MSRYNFKSVETKWQSFWEKNKSFKVKTDPSKKKNSIALKCFRIHLEEFIWDTSEIIQLVTF